ncbi:FAD-dependent oxidoreductase, partial [Alphaproteobacteria bacterium]|nr:FAD-dependent oxidoreductase [Alphaproteobacteria bacterium]
KFPFKLDLIRGSHIILEGQCRQPFFLEVPKDNRFIFILPWKDSTLVGTTEVRQSLNEQIICGKEEKEYLLNAWSYYFPKIEPKVIDSFAGVRPLIHEPKNPSNITRDYAIHKADNLVTIYGGKWTTALALAKKVVETIS